jgi:IMP dehydrogenase/GMP reductase
VKTRVTELLGCKYPILEGAMAAHGTWELAAVVANTGAFGLITASTSKTPEKLREDIKNCRNATDGAFGVNLSFGICPRIEEMLEVCIEEKVPIETAIYKPDSLATRIEQSGITWIHKSARVKDAKHAEELGADAVIVVGLEGTGFKNPEQLPTLITTVWGARQIKVPFISAGGIADAHGFLGALAMGADGIMMGTAFMLTKECPLKDSVKEAIVGTSPDNPRLRHRVLDPPDPKAYAEVMEMRDKLPLGQWLRMVERVNLKDKEWQGDPQQRPAQEGPEQIRMVSLAVAAIDHIPTVKELVDNIVRGSEAIWDSWQSLGIR